jgi:hypothetical protein
LKFPSTLQKKWDVRQTAQMHLCEQYGFQILQRNLDMTGFTSDLSRPVKLDLPMRVFADKSSYQGVNIDLVVQLADGTSGTVDPAWTTRNKYYCDELLDNGRDTIGYVFIGDDCGGRNPRNFVATDTCKQCDIIAPVETTKFKASGVRCPWNNKDTTIWVNGAHTQFDNSGNGELKAIDYGGENIELVFKNKTDPYFKNGLCCQGSISVAPVFTMEPCKPGEPSQLWQYVDQGADEGQLKSSFADNFCIKSPGQLQNLIKLAACSNTDPNQKWERLPNAATGSHTTLKQKGTNNCIGLIPSDHGGSDFVTLQTCNQNDDKQLFTFTSKPSR